MIKAGDSQLARIDVIEPGFLAREDIVKVDLPSHRAPLEAAILREGTTSSCLSLEAEIDQFKLVEHKEVQGEPMIQVSDLEDELDRSSVVRSPRLIVARLGSTLEEEDDMPLNN